MKSVIAFALVGLVAVSTACTEGGLHARQVDGKGSNSTSTAGASKTDGIKATCTDTCKTYVDLTSACDKKLSESASQGKSSDADLDAMSLTCVCTIQYMEALMPCAKCDPDFFSLTAEELASFQQDGVDGCAAAGHPIESAVASSANGNAILSKDPSADTSKGSLPKDLKEQSANTSSSSSISPIPSPPLGNGAQHLSFVSGSLVVVAAFAGILLR